MTEPDQFPTADEAAEFIRRKTDVDDLRDEVDRLARKHRLPRHKLVRIAPLLTCPRLAAVAARILAGHS